MLGEAFELVLLRGLRREEDDGDEVGLGVGLERAAQPEAVELRHHHVGDDEVGQALAGQRQPRLAVGGFENAVAGERARGGFEVATDVGAHFGVVFHDEDRRHVGGVQGLLNGGLQQVHVGVRPVPVRGIDVQRRPVARRQRRGVPIDLIRREVRPPEREREGESAPEAHLARDRQRPPVQIHHLLRQRQPDAGAQLRLRRLVDLIEPVEDVGQLRRRDARAAVADDHARRAARCGVARGLDAHAHGPGLWRELDRVREQVGDGLLELRRIGEDLDGCVRALDLERDRLARCHRLERLRDALDERAEVECAGAERRPPGFEAGHVEDLVDEVEDAAGAAPGEVDLPRPSAPPEARTSPAWRSSSGPSVSVSGVRNSWLTLAKNALLAASSVCRLRACAATVSFSARSCSVLSSTVASSRR